MWDVIGHSRAVSMLQRSLERETLAHAYLMVGPAHVGKMTLAVNLAQALNCEADEPPCGDCDSCRKAASGKHADVQIIGLILRDDSEGSKLRAEIGIDQIREMQSSASLPPFEGKYKVFIVDGAELMSNEAANCLLKTLEEPTGRVIFILLTVDERLLPATVVSRCQQLDLPPLTIVEIEAALGSRWGVEPQKARLLAGLCHGCLGWAVSVASDDSLLQLRAERIDKLLHVVSADNEARFAYASQLAVQFGKNRKSVQETLDFWIEWWRDLLLVKAGCTALITNIDFEDTLVEQAGTYSLAEIKSVIDSLQAAGEQLGQNANPRLVLEVLMLSLPRKEVRGEENLTSRYSVKYG